MKSRILILFTGMMLLGSTLLLRAAWLQFLPNSKLKTLKNRQFETIVTLPSRRGAIVDRQGRDLAMSTAAFSLYADPKIMTHKKSVAKKLAKELGLSVDTVYSKIKDPKRRFSWIQRRVDRDTMENIQAMKIRGLSFVEEWKRIYPNENLMPQILGFLGNEGQGLEGLELKFEETLKGNKKKVAVKRDARGRPLVSDGLLFTENPEGHEIHLTIDSELQYNLENELHRVMTEFEAVGAMGVILDAQTSAILAMGTVPTFDLNKVSSTPTHLKRNRAITDFFEPGSVIKPFVAAKGIKDKLIQPNSKYFCEMGQWKIGKRTIRESDSNHKFGNLSIMEILAFSSNVGTGKMALDMGQEKVREGLTEFGFGQKSGVDLPGEVKGILHNLPWNPHLTANISFGQGMTATMLQVANAYAVLANGGVLKKPYIVEKVKNVETGEIEEYKPEEIRRVLTKQEAESMRMILTAVTHKDGTGYNARVPGFQVAGKTGTAQKARTDGRGYERGAYIASFAGMIPAHKPEFVIYVAVDHPKKAYYAGTVAAPLFSRVASFAVRKKGLAPSLIGNEDYIPAHRTVAVEKRSESEQQKALPASEIVNTQGRGRLDFVPELKDMSLREVMRKVQGQEVKLKTVGQGKVVHTWPKPGDPLNENQTLIIFME